ncbi:tenascin-like [Anneissia japonica]|uniref:tenascin-like n=1 Tax=Anneissia japonica TaxID=1529436 RepID=UPI00142568E5|nr:tenascin-like [Anneissia japonica]
MCIRDSYKNLYHDSSLTFNSVSVEDGGMYELYLEGQRDDYKHSFIELLVRGCPAGRYGAPRCTGICNNCYNGGVCDDETGKCVCPPGFKGENCMETCGGNTFGITCEIKCTRRIENPQDACKGFQFCLPNPYGCDCVTGYTGLDCLTDCGFGKFGAGCSQDCHCASGGCNQYTGECLSGTCAPGWSGSNCQVPSTCPVGYFDSSCTLICHCLDNVECDKNTGVCSNGECAKGYHTYDSPFCEACQSRSYDYYCALTCYCDSASCHHETGCDGGCLDNWLGNTCTTGIISISNAKVNPRQMSTFQCDIQGDVTDITIQFLIDSQPAAETGRTKSNRVTTVSFTGEANPDAAYVCKLTKDSYTANATHSLTTYVFPTYNGRPAAETITGSSVKLRWREWSTSSGDSGDPPIIGYVVYYKQRSLSSEPFRQAFHVSSLTATVTGLHWEEAYKFAIAAVREGTGGEGPMGSVRLTTSTVCGEPSAPVVNTISSYEFPKMISISWQQLTVEESKCSAGVDRYTISYRPVNTDVPMVTNETTKDSYTIMGLETYTEYSISVTASNKDFPGMAGVVQVFSPEEKPPPPDVSAVHEGTYLTVSVMPSESIGNNQYGDIKGYDIRYRLADSDEEWIDVAITKDQGSNGYKITSLETDADYEVSARVINGAGAGYWSCSTKAVTGCSTGTGSSIPGFMIALVVVLFIIIFLLSLAFGLYYRYKNSNGKNMDKCEVQVTANTQVVEEENELDNYTKLIKDDLTQENQYDVIQTGTQDTYDYAMPQTSRLEIPLFPRKQSHRGVLYPG